MIKLWIANWISWIGIYCRISKNSSVNFILADILKKIHIILQHFMVHTRVDDRNQKIKVKMCIIYCKWMSLKLLRWWKCRKTECKPEFYELLNQREIPPNWLKQLKRMSSTYEGFLPCPLSYNRNPLKSGGC